MDLSYPTTEALSYYLVVVSALARLPVISGWHRTFINSKITVGTSASEVTTKETHRRQAFVLRRLSGIYDRS
jgi:hypothetical protein